jgi:hypothetical protein
MTDQPTTPGQLFVEELSDLKDNLDEVKGLMRRTKGAVDQRKTLKMLMRTMASVHTIGTITAAALAEFETTLDVVQRFQAATGGERRLADFVQEVLILVEYVKSLDVEHSADIRDSIEVIELHAERMLVELDDLGDDGDDEEPGEDDDVESDEESDDEESDVEDTEEGD